LRARLDATPLQEAEIVRVYSRLLELTP